MTTNLTTFLRNAPQLRVMRHADRIGLDAGAASDFYPDLALIQVGDSQGADEQRGAYDWWLLTINGETVGELRDDAAGMTIHVEKTDMTNHPNRNEHQFVVLTVLSFQGRHPDSYSPMIADDGNPRIFSQDEAEATRRARQRFDPIHLPNRATGGSYIVRSLRWWRDHADA
jgi:hypothetical protein